MIITLGVLKMPLSGAKRRQKVSKAGLIVMVASQTSPQPCIFHPHLVGQLGYKIS